MIKEDEPVSPIEIVLEKVYVGIEEFDVNDPTHVFIGDEQEESKQDPPS